VATFMAPMPTTQPTVSIGEPEDLAAPVLA
jgi:hypothetical protein